MLKMCVGLISVMKTLYHKSLKFSAQLPLVNIKGFFYESIMNQRID